MVGGIEVGGIADGAAELDRLEGVGIVEGNEFGYEIRPLRFQPEVE